MSSKLYSIDCFEKVRQLTFGFIKDLSSEQLMMIPEKSSNNIWWNIAHLVLVQERLHYVLSGLPCDIKDDDGEYYGKGTSPAEWKTTPDVAEIKRLKDKFLEQPAVLRARYESGEFADISYKPYMTSTGIELVDIEGAIEFNNLHEGIHLGVIMGLKKQV